MTLGEEKARELEQALDSVENALEWYDDAEAFAEFYDFRRKLCMNLGRLARFRQTCASSGRGE